MPDRTRPRGNVRILERTPRRLDYAFVGTRDARMMARQKQRATQLSRPACDVQATLTTVQRAGGRSGRVAGWCNVSLRLAASR